MEAAWKARFREAMRETGIESIEEHAKQRPGVHVWFRFRADVSWHSCCICGLVRRRDGKNKPCPGVARVSTRRETPCSS